MSQVVIDMILPIKKKWFDMIRSGEKKEEYRKMSHYYGSRLNRIIGTASLSEVLFEHAKSEPYVVLFRNGYSRQSPSFIAEVTVHKGYGKEEWGAVQGEEYYVFDILAMEEEMESNR